MQKRRIGGQKRRGQKRSRNLNYSSASCRRRGKLGAAIRKADARERYQLICQAIIETGQTYQTVCQQFQVSLNTVKRAMRWQRSRGAEAENRGPKAEGPKAETGGQEPVLRLNTKAKGRVINLRAPLPPQERVHVLEQQVAYQGQQIEFLVQQLASQDGRQAARHSQSLASAAAL